MEKQLTQILLVGMVLLASCQTAKQPSPGMPYRLSTISYQVDDEKLQEKINRARKKSVFKKGQPYRIYDFDRERKRLLTLLEKQGITNMNWRQISFQVDTTLSDQKFSVLTVINTKN